ncbi:CfaE/CblD family pilus tip adhesin [Klebsiella michiganensis]|uniref:CfaE/CblD family pilus tip adhesin n=1 Tax=Klebsiella michiganensis TaxID=1134687 RepID=UPI003D96027E
MKLIKFLLVCGALISSCDNAMAVAGPTPNVITTQEYEIPSGAPADVKLWSQDYNGSTGYNASFGNYACDYPDIQQTCTHSSSDSTITIILKERRSQMSHLVKIKGYLQTLRYESDDPSKSYECGPTRALNSNLRNDCDPDTPTNSRALTVWIPQSEMNNLPVGGIWEGVLKLQYRAWGGGNVINYTANITLKGKATGKQDIYFPEFSGANPLVLLDLHPTGSVTGNSYVEDTTTLDMCLYDGYNSNSDSMTLTFKDEGKTAAGRKTNYFSIYNTAAGGTANTERIDYRVEMFDPHSKGWITVRNHGTFTLSAGVNGTDKIRPVRLPSIPYPVLCAPTPLRLIVDKFRVTDKSAGYYRGTLTVEFSPSLNSI